MRKQLIMILFLLGCFVQTAWGMPLPVGTLTIERKSISDRIDIFFIARNMTGQPGFESRQFNFTDFFFVFHYTDDIHAGITQVVGPDGKVYSGFNGNTNFGTYEMTPGGINGQAVVNTPEDIFNIDDPLDDRVGFKSRQTELGVLSAPYTIGDQIFLYPTPYALPEPASILLFSLGALGLPFFRRNH